MAFFCSLLTVSTASLHLVTALDDTTSYRLREYSDTPRSTSPLRVVSHQYLTLLPHELLPVTSRTGNVHLSRHLHHDPMIQAQAHRYAQISVMDRLF
ncbi:hypothetical protein B0H19DRAFT_330965 [Mycena capillaripes]|nr:hypothetical protein B0H19DRAFT_330965 [Mycena capillaripes]